MQDSKGNCFTGKQDTGAQRFRGAMKAEERKLLPQAKSLLRAAFLQDQGMDAADNSDRTFGKA